MKKLVTTILAMLMLIWVFPISASAETESLKTPVLQYKLINHDKVALRWSKIEGADMYYIYLYNAETGKYKKEGEVKTTSCRITELQANTKYTYAISAVKVTDIGVVKSKVRRINFITPDEWIYYGNSNDEYKKTYRKHYDGSDDQEFKLINNYNRRISLSKNSDPYFADGYIYYFAYEPDVFPPDEEFYRMDNNGDIKSSIYLGTYGVDHNWYSFYPINDQQCYLTQRTWDECLTEDYETLISLNSSVIIDVKINQKIYECKNYYIYDIVVIDDYIYFIQQEDSTDPKSIIYRIKPDGSDIELVAELKSSRGYLLGYNDEYLYYAEREIKSDTSKYVVKKFSTGETHSKPQELVSINCLYIINKEISNGYIYLTAYDTEEDYENENFTYYCVKINGKGLTKSDKPFEWRY